MIEQRQASEPVQAAGPHPAVQELSSEERRLIGSLAATVVPSDELGPGAEEVDLLPAFEALFASMPAERQRLYRSGLQAIDALARRRHGRPFQELAYFQRVMLLSAVERAHERGHGGGDGLRAAARRRVWQHVNAWRGYGESPTLFPHLVRDMLDLFYATPTAWEWLGYSGPPFPRGWDTLYRSEARHA